MEDRGSLQGVIVNILVIFLLCLTCVPNLPVSAAEQGFREATPGRKLTFPRDHGKHPDFQTEWWYFTGNLSSEHDSDNWGFQLTFFRRSMLKDASRGISAWGIRDFYPAHFALSDLKNRQFFHTQVISREGPGLAGAQSDNLDVKVRDWTAKMDGEVIQVSAREKDYSLSLRLVPEKPIVLHGEEGFSCKSDSEAQASYYYSFTRLRADGTLTFRGKSHRVSGMAWMDHEFASSVVLPDQMGWDWFSLQLDDGTEIMVSQMRKKSGALQRPFGTLVEKDGAYADLENEQIRISPTRTWKSPHTRAVYPSRWTLEIPDRNISLQIEPAFADQEHSKGGPVGVAYWEGAVVVSGTRDGRNVHGRGYVELTGYAGSLGGLL
jgi:predicted secreted hydrolase